MRTACIVFETKQSSSGYNFDHYVTTFSERELARLFISDQENSERFTIKEVGVREVYMSPKIKEAVRRREELLQELADLDRTLLDGDDHQ